MVHGLAMNVDWHSRFDHFFSPRLEWLWTQSNFDHFYLTDIPDMNENIYLDYGI